MVKVTIASLQPTGTTLVFTVPLPPGPHYQSCVAPRTRPRAAQAVAAIDRGPSAAPAR